jgi:hypothetical protein
VAGLPDPDVDRVRIIVEVRAPAHDIAGPGGTLDGTYRVVYQTERALPALPPGPTPDDAGLTEQQDALAFSRLGTLPAIEK